MKVDTFTDINVIKSFTTLILFANKEYKHKKEFFRPKLVFSKKVSKDIKSNGSFTQKMKITSITAHIVFKHFANYSYSNLIAIDITNYQKCNYCVMKRNVYDGEDICFHTLINLYYVTVVSLI